MSSPRRKRREKLTQLLKTDPFLTDQQIAEFLGVSVATIRLDRMALNIPELRERTKDMAALAQSKLRAMQGAEVIGELIDIELGSFGISILGVTHEMVFERNQILRGHYLFAQGNSLAVAVVNSELALTATANVRFSKAVKLNERVIAKANVIEIQGNRYRIHVESKVHDELVFRGEFIVADVGNKEVEAK